jgi:ABC-type glutathione transport system ATPase component
LVAQVLTPYLDGVKARLDALQDVTDAVATMVQSANTFFTDKHLTFDLRKGFTVMLPDESELSAERLSSGETQLLLLLCNLIAARDDATLFLIDEPELSLNVKWQRFLVQALLRGMEGSQCQLVLATHSLDLIAQYDSRVRLLKHLAAS